MYLRTSKNKSEKGKKMFCTWVIFSRAGLQIRDLLVCIYFRITLFPRGSLNFGTLHTCIHYPVCKLVHTSTSRENYRWVGPEPEPERRARAFYLKRPHAQLFHLCSKADEAQACLKPNLFSKFFKPEKSTAWSRNPEPRPKVEKIRPDPPVELKAVPPLVHFPYISVAMLCYFGTMCRYLADF
jgi:hypothetical protein